jgi:hypothetical protein
MHVFFPSIANYERIQLDPMKSSAIVNFDFPQRLISASSVHVFGFCSAPSLNPLPNYFWETELTLFGSEK